MKDIEQLCSMADWCAMNLAYNLDFVPADKIEWKPEPTTKSVLEIVNEPVGFMQSIISHIDTGSWEHSNPKAENIEDAKKALAETTAQYTGKLKMLTEEDLASDVQTPFGVYPMRFMVGMPVIDLIHHHGQIAYIQTLLGDTESHFAPMG